MDWKTFIVQIVDATVWPAVVVLAIYQLKDKIGELLPRLKKLKHKETEIEFAEKITELVNESKDESNLSFVAKSRETKDQFEILLKLADISPRSAVLEAFRYLENASAKAVAKAYPECAEKDIRNPMLVQKLLKGKILSLEQNHRMRELRMLRNKAAHIEDFSLHGMPIEAYLDMTLTLASQLEQYESEQ